MKCPRCEKDNHVKSGFMKGKQRYKCKECGCFFTQSAKRGYSLELKRQAIKYYLEGNGFRRIERLLPVSHVTVLYWVRSLSKKLEEYVEKNKKNHKVDIVELDEMYTFIKKNLKKPGYGLQLKEIPKKYWDIMLDVVMK